MRPQMVDSLAGVLVMGALSVAGACSSENAQVGRSSFADGGSGGAGPADSGGGSAGTTGGAAGGGAFVQPDSGPITGDSGGGLGLDAACAGSVLNSQLNPSTLLFVIDRSGSMNCNLPSDGQSTAACEAMPQKLDPLKPSKWELTRTALNNALTALSTSGVVTAGLSVFPTDSECAVTEVPAVSLQKLDATQVTAIGTFLNLPTVQPKGSTPLAGATVYAYMDLYERLKQNPTFLNQFVVLLTDGFETCKADFLPSFLPQVKDALSVSIRTFVIGVPGSEDGRQLLSTIAKEGGTARTPDCTAGWAPDTTTPSVGDCHFDLTQSTDFAAELAARLTEISGATLSCELDVPKPPDGGQVDLTKVNVRINGQDILLDTSLCNGGSNGWQYNADLTKILLCGTACTLAQQPNAKVEVILGCPTIVH